MRVAGVALAPDRASVEHALLVHRVGRVVELQCGAGSDGHGLVRVAHAVGARLEAQEALVDVDVAQGRVHGSGHERDRISADFSKIVCMAAGAECCRSAADVPSANPVPPGGVWVPPKVVSPVSVTDVNALICCVP